MSTLSDVQDLYGSARSTWVKSQAHVFAHIGLALILFAVCRVTLPEIHMPRLSAAEISNNEWFKLAKDTGVVYVSFAIPLVILAIYGGLLRTVGQWLIVPLALFRGPGSRILEPRIINEGTLEPLALIVKRKDFELIDLTLKSAELAIRYSLKKGEQYEAYQRGLADLTKNSTIYLGDFLVFWVSWVALFYAFPYTSWVQENHSKYSAVFAILLALIIFFWFRVSRALSVQPSLQLLYVSFVIRTDPDMAALLDVSEEARLAVNERLQELLTTERKLLNREPSLSQYIGRRLRVGERGDNQDAKERSGWPFQATYEQGRKFAWDETENRNYDNHWLQQYVAYLYYRAYRRLAFIAASLIILLRRIVIGTPY